MPPEEPRHASPPTPPPVAAPSSRSHSNGPRFQFSLWWLMMGVTIAAIMLGLAVVMPAFIRLIGVSLYLAFPTPFVVAIVYARGDVRAFAIGALIPWVALWSDGFSRSTDISSLIGLMIWLVLFGGLCGTVAVATRRWLERHGMTDDK